MLGLNDENLNISKFHLKPTVSSLQLFRVLLFELFHVNVIDNHCNKKNIGNIYTYTDVSEF